MSLILVAIAAVVIVGPAAGVRHQIADKQVPIRELSYGEFMKLSVDQRQLEFSKLTAENKSTLKRTHAKHWLDANGKDLSPAQTALVREAMDFLSPDLYRKPYDAELSRRQDDLSQRLVCSLGLERVRAAFTFLGPNPEPDLHRRIGEWLSWFSECLVK